MTAIDVPFKILSENAVVPFYANPGDAGLDLTATEIVSETSTHITYGTGISLAIPEGFVGLIFPRSSIRKYSLSLANGVGVIDSGYRGEIQFTFRKELSEGEPVFYKPGDRIGQLVIIPYPTVRLVSTETLSDTERGTGGFGSSGR